MVDVSLELWFQQSAKLPGKKLEKGADSTGFVIFSLTIPVVKLAVKGTPSATPPARTRSVTRSSPSFHPRCCSRAP